MRWEGERQSANVEDRRGTGGGGRLAIGGGIGGVVLLVLGLLFGVDPSALLSPDSTGTHEVDPAQQPVKEFVGVTLGYTEDVWHKLFRQKGWDYREPRLVLFDRSVDSACGFASAATGPFYCPEDETVYLDLEFFRELSDRYGASGDFAMAYVVAHEVGHHVQKLLGNTQRVAEGRRSGNEDEANRLSVRLELQADFLAGVFAHHAEQMKSILEPGDLDEAIRAASAIGDDRLQKQAQGYVVPDSFTHGTSTQRARWFKIGFQTGDLDRGDTFSIPYDEL